MAQNQGRRRCMQAVFSLPMLAGWQVRSVWAQTPSAPGRLQWVEGAASVVGATGLREVAVTGGWVQEGQTVETGTGATAHVLLADGALLVLRADSAFTLVAYGATAKLEDSASLTLLRGALRMVTGWLAKTSPRSVALRTRTTTVGIRGTDFEMVDDGSDTHVRVHSGEVLMGNAKNSVALGAGEIGTLSGAGGGITRHAPDAAGAQQAFDARRGLVGASDEVASQHARNINQHMEASLRESGMLRGDQSLAHFVESRKAAVDHMRARGAMPGKDEAVERMHDLRERAVGGMSEKSKPGESMSPGQRGGRAGGGGGGGRR